MVFDVSRIVRAHGWLNQRLTHVAHGVQRWIDRAWAGPLPDDIVSRVDVHGVAKNVVRESFPVDAFWKLALLDTPSKVDKLGMPARELDSVELPPSSNFLRLAQLAAAQLRVRWPGEQHRAWYHGVEDGWLVWVMMMFDELIEATGCAAEELRVASKPLTCVRRNSPIVNFEASDTKTTLLWYSVSGSDDLLWVSLALFSDFQRYYPARYALNGRRGIEQLSWEVGKRFEEQGRDATTISFRRKRRRAVLLDWGTNRNYVATIGLSLMAQVSAGVAAHADMVPQNTRTSALRNAENVMATLHTFGLISDDHVYDGFSHAENAGDGPSNVSSLVDPATVNRAEWSYNVATAVGALTALYRATRKGDYLIEAEKLLRGGVRRFIPNMRASGQSPPSMVGLFGESESAELNRDQLAFKGIFFHFLADFVRTYRCRAAHTELPSWMRELHVGLAHQAQDLIQYRLSAERGGFCGYWGESQAEQSCAEKWMDPEAAIYGPVSLMSASQLFLATYLLGAEDNVFDGRFCGRPPASTDFQMLDSTQQTPRHAETSFFLEAMAIARMFVFAAILSAVAYNVYFTYKKLHSAQSKVYQPDILVDQKRGYKTF